MKFEINPRFEPLRSFIEELPDHFDQGELIFQGRNTIRAFEVAGEKITVKRFRKPSGLNALCYGHLRKSKARRAYEHALELCRLGIPTPEPIGWREDYSGGLIRETYLITRFSDFEPLSELTNNFPAGDTPRALDAFAAFTVMLHEKGVEHGDFNNGNTQWKVDTEGYYHFELIDINRMNFRGRQLTRSESLHNLRRITCPMTAYTYILGRYGELRGWDNYYTQLAGAKRLGGFIARRDRRYALKAILRGKKR